MNDHGDMNADLSGDSVRDELTPADRLVIQAMSRAVPVATEGRLRERLEALRDRLRQANAPLPDVSADRRFAWVAAFALIGLVCAGIAWTSRQFATRADPIADTPRPSASAHGPVGETQSPQTPTPLDGDDIPSAMAPANGHDSATIPADDEGYGTLTGQFVLSGPVPVLPPLTSRTGKFAGFPAKCGATISDETLIVDPKTKGIENVVLYLPKAPSAMHPSLTSQHLSPVRFDATCGRFVPHVLFVQTNQAVACRSLDPLSYNVHTLPLRNQQSNFIIGPPPAPTAVTPGAVERLPFKVVDDIHVWMSAYWLVLDHPYAAITAKDGRFSIRQLPAGTHTIHAWHERGGYLIKSMTVTITSGEQTDLGTVSVSADRLKG